MKLTTNNVDVTFNSENLLDILVDNVNNVEILKRLQVSVSDVVNSFDNLTFQDLYPDASSCMDDMDFEDVRNYFLSNTTQEEILEDCEIGTRVICHELGSRLQAQTYTVERANEHIQEFFPGRIIEGDGVDNKKNIRQMSGEEIYDLLNSEQLSFIAGKLINTIIKNNVAEWK